MSFETKTKDPDAVLDYDWPWADNGWLPTGDTISTAVFTVYNSAGDTIPAEDTDPVVVDSSSHTDTNATAWLSGGQAAYSPYLITCHIVTADGREDDRTLKLKIAEK